MIDEIQESEKQQEPLERWISFYLGDERYAIELKRVREILRINNIVPVPGAQDYVIGITNIRGSVVTVIDGRSRMNLPGQPQTDLSRIIVVEYIDEAVGIVVDSVADVVDLPLSAIEANPKMNAHEGNKYIKGVASNDSDLVIIINVDKFLGIDQSAPLAVGF